MSQFTCTLCGDGFDQKSRYERHMATAHPPSALTAADVEKALAGIQFPGHRDKIVDFAAGSFGPGSEVLRALEALPDREYRDAADVAIAFGESKGAGPVRTAEQVAATEAPSRKGGRAAATEAPSAAAVAAILGGIDFPKPKEYLLEYARRHEDALEDPAPVLRVIDDLPDREYRSMADVETEVGKVR